MRGDELKKESKTWVEENAENTCPQNFDILSSRYRIIPSQKNARRSGGKTLRRRQNKKKYTAKCKTQGLGPESRGTGGSKKGTHVQKCGRVGMHSISLFNHVPMRTLKKKHLILIDHFASFLKKEASTHRRDYLPFDSFGVVEPVNQSSFITQLLIPCVDASGAEHT